MKIIADKNIIYVKEAFSFFGDVELYTTRINDKNVLKDAEVLLTRSTMKINEDLLEGTNIKFVATATSGYEHVDIEYLNKKGIVFADAKGSNSNSVSEYIVAALLSLSQKNKFELKGKTIGVVGYGCVGTKVEKKVKTLGMNVLINDPPLKRITGNSKFLPLDDLMDCDIITLHVPMIKKGEDKTYFLFDEKRLSMMKKGSILINSSRGGVVEEAAIKKYISNGYVSHAILDVWENEPNINVDMFDYASVATPHIAGHSFDGKVLGTSMIYEAFCDFLGEKKEWNYKKLLPKIIAPEINIDSDDLPNETILSNIIKKVYGIEDDDKDFRKIKLIEKYQRQKYFDNLRGQYKVRREFFNYKINPGNRKDLREMIESLGFHCG